MMHSIANFVNWFLFGRKVVIERLDREQDLTHIRIVEKNGTQEITLARNDAFSLAWVFREARERGIVKGITIGFSHKLSDGTISHFDLVVPDWATNILRNGVIHFVTKELGWKGECPKPFERVPYR